MNKIGREEAVVLAEAYFVEHFEDPEGHGYAVWGELVRETPEGWVVPYNSKKWFEKPDEYPVLVGNLPIFVSSDGLIVEPRDQGSV